MNHLGNFDVGQQVVFVARFRNAVRALANPSTVAFSVRRPTGTTVVNAPDADITNPSTGVFRFTYMIDDQNDPGRWTIRAEGTGNGVTTAREATLDVNGSAF